MKIHFVCTGNYYRSRLAESYLKSKELPTVEASSSGTQAVAAYLANGPISWYGLRLIRNNSLIPFMKKLPTQTTGELLRDADMVIFMTKAHVEYARETFSFNGNYEVWNIADLDQFHDDDIALETDIHRMQVTEKTFQEIRERIDDLVKRLDDITEAKVAGE